MEQVEVVDIKPENDLRKVWADFIHSHHYDVTDDFFDSWLATHPRRTGEAFVAQYVEALYVDGNPVPRNVALQDLRDWFRELIAVEEGQQDTLLC